jgi:hypothetical protein
VTRGLQCGLSGNPVLLLATGQFKDERETAVPATGSSFWGNPTGPKAVRFTRVTTTSKADSFAISFFNIIGGSKWQKKT